VHAHLGRRAADDDRPIEIGPERIAHRAKTLGSRQVMGRQRGHSDQFAEGRHGLVELADQVGEVEGILDVVAEVLAVEELQLFGNQGIVAEAYDRRDYLVGLAPGELPLLADVVGRDGFRPMTSRSRSRAAMASRISW
jgi:hypothetical protein